MNEKSHSNVVPINGIPEINFYIKEAQLKTNNPTPAKESNITTGTSVWSCSSAFKPYGMFNTEPYPEQKEGDQENSKPDPFSPECCVPLPFQLGDDYGDDAYANNSEENVELFYAIDSLWKRNERERYRVRCVNEGYERLRNHLPLRNKSKRISKVETLRLAIRYIKYLQDLLADDGSTTITSVSSQHVDILNNRS